MLDHKEKFVKQAQGIAADLRDMADRIDYEIVLHPSKPDVVARRIVHEIMWGIANLNLDGLIVKLMRIVEHKSEMKK